MRILVVDDDIIQQQVLACFLVANGFHVETALSGLEAIRKARLDAYHVVLMDHAMAEVDGMSAAAVIRRNSQGFGYPWLIALSANLQRVIEEEAAGGPVFDLLEQKPWRPDRLLELLDSCKPPAPQQIERKLPEPHGQGMDYALLETKIVTRYERHFDPNGSSSTGTMKVLLVDSDPALLCEFTKSLTALGYDVDTVGSKTEALQRISSQPYDVVLADYLTLDRYCGSAAGFAHAAGSGALGARATMQQGFQPDRDSAATGAPGAATGPMRVLVVDDNGLNCDVLASILRADGNQVTCVESGEDAVVATLTTAPDVILMDVRMPVVGGLEATRRIRAEAELQACVPIIGMTTQTSREEAELCLAAGMDGYLIKPLDQSSVIAAVTRAGAIKQRVCAKHQAERVAQRLEPPLIGSEMPALDQTVYDHTTSCLGAAKAAGYLQMLATNAGALLQKLTSPAAETQVPSDLVDEVHALGGSAGVFGFTRLLEVSRRYERAVGLGAADIPQHIQGLIAALEVTLEGLHPR